MSELRAGVIGTGRAAGFIDDEVKDHPLIRTPYCHAAAYAEVGGVQLVAAASRGRERLETFGSRYGVTALYTDYREMLSKERLDIVSVTTHAPLHAECVIAAAAVGVRGIYCEKAMAASLAECDAMLDACAKSGTVLLIGHSRRYAAYYDRVEGIIRAGEIGSLSVVAAYWGGSLVHTGTHGFDLICQMVGSAPTTVTGRLHPTPDYDSTDYGKHDVGGNGVVGFANGVRALIGATGGKALGWDFDFIGSRGVLRCMGNSSRLELVTPHGRWNSPRSVDLELPPPTSTTVRAVTDLVHCLQNGGTPKSSGSDGRTALEIAHGFHHSHRRGGATVRLPLADRSLRVLNR